MPEFQPTVDNVTVQVVCGKIQFEEGLDLIYASFLVQGVVTQDLLVIPDIVQDAVLDAFQVDPDTNQVEKKPNISAAVQGLVPEDTLVDTGARRILGPEGRRCLQLAYRHNHLCVMGRSHLFAMGRGSLTAEVLGNCCNVVLDTVLYMMYKYMG